MNIEIFKSILQHAKESFPKECCGFVADGKVYRTENKAGSSDSDYFVIDALELAPYQLKGTMEAIYHSHPIYSPEPSLADLYAIADGEVPWYIINPTTEQLTITTPDQAKVKINNLKTSTEILGREFVWGYQDCYALVRDVYKAQRNIELPNYDRGLLFAWEVDKSWDKFQENFHNAGFEFIHKGALIHDYRVDLQKFDVILFAINSTFGNSNHCGLIMDENSKTFWHHLYGRVSESAIYGGFFKNTTTGILRYTS